MTETESLMLVYFELDMIILELVKPSRISFAIILSMSLTPIEARVNTVL